MSSQDATAVVSENISPWLTPAQSASAGVQENIGPVLTPSPVGTAVVYEDVLIPIPVRTGAEQLNVLLTDAGGDAGLRTGALQMYALVQLPPEPVRIGTEHLNILNLGTADAYEHWAIGTEHLSVLVSDPVEITSPPDQGIYIVGDPDISPLVVTGIVPPDAEGTLSITQGTDAPVTYPVTGDDEGAWSVNTAQSLEVGNYTLTLTTTEAEYATITLNVAAVPPPPAQAIFLA